MRYFLLEGDPAKILILDGEIIKEAKEIAVATPLVLDEVTGPKIIEQMSSATRHLPEPPVVVVPAPRDYLRHTPVQRMPKTDQRKPQGPGTRANGEVRERIEGMLLDGRTPKEIAETLGTSQQNVYNHKSRLIRDGKMERAEKPHISGRMHKAESSLAQDPADELSPEAEEKLVWSIRDKWIVENKKVPLVLMELGISMNTFRRIVIKHGIEKKEV